MPDLQCIKVNPTWSKGYARKGAALHGHRRYVEAIEAYEDGLKVEDSPALRKGLEEVKAAKGACLCISLCIFSTLTYEFAIFFYTAADERGDGADAMGLGKMFSDPGMFAKLASNPRTAKHLADASFMQKVCVLWAVLRGSPLITFSSSSNSYSRIPNWRRACLPAIHV